MIQCGIRGNGPSSAMRLPEVGPQVFLIPGIRAWIPCGDTVGGLYTKDSTADSRQTNGWIRNAREWRNGGIVDKG